jgi:hypothetical protein
MSEETAGVFVSYSHDDNEWLIRFSKMSKPLSRYAEIDLWSDKRIKAGADWRAEINKAMANAIVAVLLVSANFLNSDFIANEELPYILEAAKKQKIKILWVRLTPCLYQLTPLDRPQAAAGFPDPLNKMTEYGWMEAFCSVCDQIDKIVREIETPVINSGLKGKILQREQPNLQVLAKPATRDTEVLIFSGDGWHTQQRIPKGSTKTKCWIGDTKHTKPGDSFKILALTREYGKHLSLGTKHPNLPLHRTRSAEVTVKRA